ncbi:MAG: hypothetical protein J6R27_01000 [Muribaculaceae bacterium]|nr:hypothetical protein [Muribaculaceae bacterium]
MKSVFITYNQALNEDVMVILKSSLCRGYTHFSTVGGCGSETGEPHLGTHAWPTMNSAVITICEDYKVEPLFERLRALNEENKELGLRAFVWNVEQTL